MAKGNVKTQLRIVPSQSVVVDSNLFILYLVGLFSIVEIELFEKSKNYSYSIDSKILTFFYYAKLYSNLFSWIIKIGGNKDIFTPKIIYSFTFVSLL